MTLYPPFFISSALRPALRINDACVLHLMNVEFEASSGRHRATFLLETSEFTYTDAELRTGVGRIGPPAVELFETFLSFLEAAADAVEYSQRDPGRPSDNLDLFPLHVMTWAHEYADDIGMVRCDLCDENGAPNLALISGKDYNYHGAIA